MFLDIVLLRQHFADASRASLEKLIQPLITLMIIESSLAKVTNSFCINQQFVHTFSRFPKNVHILTTCAAVKRNIQTVLSPRPYATCHTLIDGSLRLIDAKLKSRVQELVLLLGRRTQGR